MTVSAIIPCFNAETTIERAIVSVVSQTIPVFEIIVVNDGSTDTSGRLLEGLKLNYPQLKVIHQENKGVSYARNIAIEAALGNYILTLDADDYFDPSFVEKALIKFSEDASYGGIMCGYVRILKEKKVKPYIPPMVSLSSCLVNNGVISCLLFKKEVLLTVGAYDNAMSKGYEDWDLNIRILKLGYTFGVVKEVLFNYSDIKGSRTTIATKYDLELKLQIYDKYKDDYRDNARYIYKELVQQNNNLKQEKQKVLDSTSFKIGHRIVSSLSFVLKILKFKST
ncbi:glycosyltransferase family A protein [Flavobacterium sp. 83]|uniref:glycosyltransferase family 2 protein n=1 Tax=Flavobacterium sp. 83 TaxID=1131812 RepID=UPI000553085C|nr:glycosyltransferase family A protein [Flavobacterium sp. 83]